MLYVGEITITSKLGHLSYFGRLISRVAYVPEYYLTPRCGVQFIEKRSQSDLMMINKIFYD